MQDIAMEAPFTRRFAFIFTFEPGLAVKTHRHHIARRHGFNLHARWCHQEAFAVTHTDIARSTLVEPQLMEFSGDIPDRKSVVSGKRVSVRLNLVGPRIIK